MNNLLFFQANNEEFDSNWYVFNCPEQGALLIIVKINFGYYLISCKALNGENRDVFKTGNV